MDISVNNRMIHLAGVAFDIGKIGLWGSKMNIGQVKLDFSYSQFSLPVGWYEKI